MKGADQSFDNIADYVNAKASLLTSRQPTALRIGLVSVLALVLMLASIFSESEYVHPRVVAQFSNELTIDYRFGAQASSAQCEAVVNEFKATLAGVCPGCELTSSCSSIDGTLLDLRVREDAPKPNLAATFNGGVGFYITPEVSMATEVCYASAIIDKSVSCLPPDDLVSSVKIVDTATRFAILAGVAVGALILLIVVFSAYRHDHMAPSQRILTGHRQSTAVVTWLTDVFSIYLAWLAVTHGLVITAPLPSSQALMLQTGLAGMGLTFWMAISLRHYARRRAIYDEVKQVLGAVALIALFHITAAAFLGTNNFDLIALVWLTVMIILPICRHLIRCVLDDFGVWRRPVVVVGIGNNAITAVNAITQDFTLGYKILAVADPDLKIPTGSTLDLSTGLPVISVAELEKLPETIQVIIALESAQDMSSQQIIHQLIAANRRVHMMPSLRGLPTMGMQVSHFFSQNTVMLTMRNNLARADYKVIKRVFDIVASSALLLLLSPLFIYVSARVKTDGGPALYGHERVGRRGKAFKCLKFRSMHVDSQNMLRKLLESNPEARDEWERDFKLKNDPRITPIGNVIRKTSIDELPQLLNVLRGDMSLVGPRPVIEDELARYGQYKSFYLRVSPGITGLWQVSGRSDTSYEERVALDVWYAQNWSLVYDIAILLKTIGVVFGRKGAY